MITKLVLRFGTAPAASPLRVDCTPVTIFIGPNNSGKSLSLREIEYLCRGNSDAPRQIIDSVEALVAGRTAMRAELKTRARKPDPTDAPGTLRIVEYSTGHGSLYVLSEEEFEGRLQDEERQIASGGSDWAKVVPFLALLIHRLDGKARLSLLDAAEAKDLLYGAENLLTHLFQEGEARRLVRKIVHDALGLYFVIDPTGMQTFRVRLSQRPPEDEEEEQALSPRARQFHGAATDLSEFGDGVKAFAGLVSAVVAGQGRILLVDEPEAFLHPALCFQLAVEMGRSAAAKRKAIFVATHSADFLMGCVQSGVPINIVRLTFEKGVATARLLPPAKLQEMMHHPLLRSTGVLSGLFRLAVVVSEADADRAFYGEINERLLESGAGVAQCLFLNAQNKQTVWTILRPLREMGVAAAAIVDVDVIKEGGGEWTKALEAVRVPKPLHESLNQLRRTVVDAFDKTGKDMKRGGRSLLVPQEQAAFDKLLQDLSEYGLFVVPGGEIESWLSGLGVPTSRKTQWLITVFEKMGSDPTAADYLRPAAGDVWEFVGRVATWVKDGGRKGMPTEV